MSPGGVGRNIAENLVRLGLRTELVTVIGDDALSAELASSCGKLGIGLRGAIRLRATAASQYLCLLDAEGFLVGAIADMDSVEKLTPERVAERSGLLDDAILIVADANLPCETLEWLAARYGRGGEAESFRRSGGPRRPLLCLDPVSVAKAPRAARILADFDFSKPNRREAEILGGVKIESEADLPRAAAALRTLGKSGALPPATASGGPPPMGLQNAFPSGLPPVDVFISLGTDGIYFDGFAADYGFERGIARPPVVEAISVSGAGDAACAALAWGRLAGYGVAERAALAVSAAALATATLATVNEETTPERLLELSKGVNLERLS